MPTEKQRLKARMAANEKRLKVLRRKAAVRDPGDRAKDMKATGRKLVRDFKGSRIKVLKKPVRRGRRMGA